MKGEPKTFDLMSQILEPGPPSAKRPKDSETLLIQSLYREEIGPWLERLKEFIPKNQEELPEELMRYYRFALLGVCVAFLDRGLSPYADEHVTIIEPMLAEIRDVFRQVTGSGMSYDKEEFCFRSYDYGIHKATYLDWKLYMSKEFY
ncbi:MAG: hypothetical protein OEZ59_10010 [Deltaproteobacteria bacterium]|nr:hypothetical protein [Deltaproteobacteria bacterium]